jgi:SAM-dependent methyltransferase
MKALKDAQDAFGHALLDCLEGRGGEEIIERSDGYIDLSAAAAAYFAEPTGDEREAADLALGRVLDIGCGAGRFALYLQSRGHEVVAVDISPLAVEVCRRRGVIDTRVLSITEVNSRLGRFDTILMMGNNFGLFGSASQTRRLLRRFARRTTASGRIIAQTLDPYQTEDAFHLAYQARNRARKRMSGQIRLRARYKGYTTPWFDYLFVSEAELAELLQGSVWQVSQVMRSTSPAYTVVLEKRVVA